MLSKISSIVIAIVLILLLILSMFIFLNPFMWGMRREKYHEFPEKFWEAATTIEKDYVFYGNGGFRKEPTLEPTEWYIKDCERGLLDKKQNLIFNLGEMVDKKLTTELLNNKIDIYAEEILPLITKKECFDSLVFTYFYRTYNYDSLKAKDYETYEKCSYKINN